MRPFLRSNGSKVAGNPNGTKVAGSTNNGSKGRW